MTLTKIKDATHLRNFYTPYNLKQLGLVWKRLAKLQALMCGNVQTTTGFTTNVNAK